VVEGKPLKAVRQADGGLQYVIVGRAGLLDPVDGEYRTVSQAFTLGSARALAGGESVPIRLPVCVRPGELEYLFQVRDGVESDDDGEPSGNYSSGTAIIRDRNSDLPHLSDLAIAPDSGGSWSVDQRVFLRPSPRHNTGQDGVAHVYFEAYGLSAAQPYRATFRLTPRDGDEEESFEIGFEGLAGRDAVSHLYFLLDLRESKPGFYDLTVAVTDVQREIESLPVRSIIHVDAPGN
jgi:hypothetical protein